MIFNRNVNLFWALFEFIELISINSVILKYKIKSHKMINGFIILKREIFIFVNYVSG